MRRVPLIFLATVSLSACGGSSSVAKLQSGKNAEADASPCFYSAPPDGSPHLLGIYALPSVSLRKINPWLTAQDLQTALDHGASSVTAPGIGSGIDFIGSQRCTLSFWMTTDRGPNGDRDSGSGKTFPLPEFTPTAVRVSVDTSSSSITLQQSLPFLARLSVPTSGLSNTDADDPPYASPAATVALPFNQNGLDVEDLRRLPSGDLLVVEEYGPSIAWIDGKTGLVKVRYTPEGHTLPEATYPVLDILPKVLLQRRMNKGFEGLAVSTDGNTAYAVLQTSLGDEDDFKDSRVDRIIRLENPTDPTRAKVTGHFIVLHGDKSDYGDAKQKSIYFNSMTYLGKDQLLLLERGGSRLQLLKTDLTQATNLVGHPELGETDVTLENDGYQKLRVNPGNTTSVFDSDDVPELILNPPDGAVSPDKLEGLTLVNDSTVALSNDNDFGIVNAQDTSRIWLLKLSANLH